MLHTFFDIGFTSSYFLELIHPCACAKISTCRARDPLKSQVNSTPIFMYNSSMFSISHGSSFLVDLARPGMKALFFWQRCKSVSKILLLVGSRFISCVFLTKRKWYLWGGHDSVRIASSQCHPSDSMVSRSRVSAASEPHYMIGLGNISKRWAECLDIPLHVFMEGFYLAIA